MKRKRLTSRSRLITLSCLAATLWSFPALGQEPELDAATNEALRAERERLIERFNATDSRSERRAILEELIKMKMDDRDLDVDGRIPTADEISDWTGTIGVSNALGLGARLADDGRLTNRDFQNIAALVAKDGVSKEEKKSLAELVDLYGDTMGKRTRRQFRSLMRDRSSAYTVRTKNKTWTSSYFPMAGWSASDEGSANRNLWAKDGAMAKVDKVIEARTGEPGTALETERRPALNWLVDKPTGYYVPSSTIRENDAERTTGVDFNGNGKIEDNIEWDFLDSRGNFGEDGEKDGTMSVGWWGRCNNVGIAGTLFKEPKKSVTVDGVTFSATEIKGLLAVYSDTIVDAKGSEFHGNRYDDQPDVIVTKDGKVHRGTIENAGELDFYTNGMFRPGHPSWSDFTILDANELKRQGKDIEFRNIETGETETFKIDDLNLIGREDKKQDTEPIVFHNNMTEWLADGRGGVLEMDPGSHVWNYNFESANVRESTRRPRWAPRKKEDLVGFNGPPGEGEITYVSARVKYNGGGGTQNYRYWIERDEEGKVLNSGWMSKNPDFMWRAKETKVDWSREVPGHPSLDPALIKELYEKSTD
ncbi:MAG: hypothetical protein QF752_00115 [Planctomycetota bacterium]|jgi:hypothetical protein|nr:hypothetical protein [Planctomycetota bacterium]